MIAEAVAIGAQAAQLPPQPRECRGPVSSGVKPEMRVDAALLRQDAAIGRANATLAACSAFYDKIREKD